MTIVYSTDIKSYKLFAPPHASRTNAIILHGSFDQTPDSDEISADRQYASVLRINADDLEESVSYKGIPASVLTIEGAKRIHAFIQQTIADERDLVVHCHAGVSRTGAVMYTALHTYHLACVHVLRWQSGRKIAEKLDPVTIENFDTFYAPNTLWMKLLKTSGE